MVGTRRVAQAALGPTARATAPPAGGATATATGGPEDRAAVAAATAAAGTTDEARGGEDVHRVVLALALAATAVAVAAAAPSRGGATVEVKASKHGFEPSQLTMRRGESVSFVLSSADDEHCLAIDALRIEKRIVPGRTTTFELIAERAGVFPFYCCLESGEAAGVERGQLTVTE